MFLNIFSFKGSCSERIPFSLWKLYPKLLSESKLTHFIIKDGRNRIYYLKSEFSANFREHYCQERISTKVFLKTFRESDAPAC